MVFFEVEIFRWKVCVDSCLARFTGATSGLRRVVLWNPADGKRSWLNNGGEDLRRFELYR